MFPPEASVYRTFLEYLLIFIASKAETKDLELFYASSKGDLEKVKKLVQGGMNPSVAGPDQRTPLHVAASEGHTEV